MRRQPDITETPVPVSLARCDNYSAPDFMQTVSRILDKTGLSISPGMRVLVKPNLLMAKQLACTNAHVVAAVCRWLLDHGAKVTVADSPGFGSADSVARAIGLDVELAPLGLNVRAFKNVATIKTATPGGTVTLPVARMALESDLIFSLAKVKAHSQMRMTLSVKNCFGCIPGLRKAFFHARYGDSTEKFAGCLASLWSILPPVAGFADGVEAMHVTGPSKGEPYPLKLLGASASAPAMDRAILAAMDIDENIIPLAAELEKSGFVPQIVYPLATPGDFDCTGFIVPATLKPASFNPWRLAKSCARRIWQEWKGKAMHKKG